MFSVRGVVFFDDPTKRKVLSVFAFMTIDPTDEEKTRTAVFQAQFDHLPLVRAFVSNAADECGLHPRAIYAVQLAVDEAFSNIIEHAFGGECQEEIQCICQIDAAGLTVHLLDRGRPFNPEVVPEPDVKAGLEDRPTGGLGLYFMRQLMDDIQFRVIHRPGEQDGCNILTMVKRREI